MGSSPSSARVPSREHRLRAPGWTPGSDDLKMIAVSRLLLDNVANVKAYWIMMGMPLAAIALHFGANDVQGTVVREEIFHAAGATTETEQKIDELVRFVEEARPRPRPARHALQRAAAMVTLGQTIPALPCATPRPPSVSTATGWVSRCCTTTAASPSSGGRGRRPSLGGGRPELAEARLARAAGSLRGRVVHRRYGELPYSSLGIDELHEELRATDVLHPVARDGVSDTGAREVAALDLDGNLVVFFEVGGRELTRSRHIRPHMPASGDGLKPSRGRVGTRLPASNQQPTWPGRASSMIRLGRISYVNMAPVFHRLDARVGGGARRPDRSERAPARRRDRPGADLLDRVRAPRGPTADPAAPLRVLRGSRGLDPARLAHAARAHRLRGGDAGERLRRPDEGAAARRRARAPRQEGGGEAQRRRSPQRLRGSDAPPRPWEAVARPDRLPMVFAVWACPDPPPRASSRSRRRSSRPFGSRGPEPRSWPSRPA